LLIGDSQTARTLGDAFGDAFSDLEFTAFGKPGATHENYLETPELTRKLADLPCADLIYIQLGDNGVSANKQTIREFIRRVRGKCPGATLFWGGPVKAVAPTIRLEHPYVVTDDPSSARYLPKYNSMRKVWIDRLQTVLEDEGVVFVDNYALQESQPRSAAFSDSRGGDGIHLTQESAEDLARLVRSRIKEVVNV